MNLTRTKVKICGLSEPTTLTTAIEAGANFIGLVFYKPSPRHLEIEEASYLAHAISGAAEIVGLFVNPSDDYIAQVLHDVKLTMIQLHGDEPPERVAEIKNKFGLPIIKALSISDENDVEEAVLYESVADWILFDARAPKPLQAIGPNGKSPLPGGNGTAFDWRILKNYVGKKPWMLAGGLTPDNVANALSILSPDAVDVSSGVESSKGIKDADKIRSFILGVKQA